MSDGKLVRDGIPGIIRAEGLEPVVRVVGAEEYAARLRDKLREEVEEFLGSDDDPEELADILEVVHALARQIGVSPEKVEELRAAKAAARGGFAEQIVWFGNQKSLTGARNDELLTAAATGCRQFAKRCTMSFRERSQSGVRGTVSSAVGDAAGGGDRGFYRLR
jgi:predicted house-cleaning noncanonical NTP pyrophosphatase (MazG superfamily)